MTDIARTLTEKKVLTPQAHKQHYGIIKASSPVPSEKRYLWLPNTVTTILESKTYTGTTISFKSHSISFKNKKRIPNDKSEQKVFENTHPAIVDKETWELVQSLLHKRRRPTKMGEMNKLSGYLYCSDCGARMTLMRALNKKNEYYYCGRYRTYEHKDVCTSHIVRADIVERLVLQNIKAVAAFVNEYEDEFVKMVSNTTDTEQNRQIKFLNKRIANRSLLIKWSFIKRTSPTASANSRLTFSLRRLAR